jgi:hypothetical protein
LEGRYNPETTAMTDRIDQTVTTLWALFGAGVVLKPSGYLGWTDLALWGAAAWFVALVGLYYLRAATSRA